MFVRLDLNYWEAVCAIRRLPAQNMKFLINDPLLCEEVDLVFPHLKNVHPSRYT